MNEVPTSAEFIQTLRAENARLKEELASLRQQQSEPIGKVLSIEEMGVGFTPPAQSESERGGYWCVVCGRYLLADDDGVIVHDPIPHLENMDFNDEEQPQ